MINIIFSISLNNAIGLDGGLPWECKKDLKYFKKITKECDDDKINLLICGFRTFMSMKHINLGNKRKLVVINRNYKHENKNIKNKNIKNTESDTEDYPNKKQKLDLFDYSCGDTTVEYEDGFPTTKEIEKSNLHSAIMYCVNQQKLNKCDKIFIIGGKVIIEKTIINYPQYLNNVYITHIRRNFDGDVFISKNIYRKLHLEDVKEDIFNVDNKPTKIHFSIYKLTQNIHEEYQYIRLLERIIYEGNDCPDRTGVGIKSIFGCQMKFDLSRGFPLLTTKKVFLRGIIEELLWFLRGETDSKILEEKKINIWKGNTSREFLDNVRLNHLSEGDIGAGYGFQFRHYGAIYRGCDEDYTNEGFDQVNYVINLIKNNPNSRRILINLWNPNELDNVVLPPCHMVYQFRVYDNKLYCSLYQRSGDMGLGVPFNIASASIMTHIFAHICGLDVGTLTHTIGDAHIYNNHIEKLKEQITRIPLPFPKLKIKNRNQIHVEDYKYSDFQLLGYISHDKLQMDMAV